MNIENLEVGTTFKNYKEMCADLGWEVKASTNSKNAQYSVLARYCKYSKMGHKITIDEVYEKPQDKIDGRGKSDGSRNNNTVYGDMIQLLILDMLAQCKKGHLSISRGKLMLTINMINNNFSSGGEQVKGLAKLTNIDEKIIYDFYNTSNSNFKNAVETALDKLMDKRIIWYESVTKIKDSVTNAHRIAKSNEIDVILEAEKKILVELGYSLVSLVRVSKHWKLFKRRVTQLLREDEDTNIDFYYFAYDINVNEKYLECEREELLKFLLQEDKRIEYKDGLNNTICENLMDNAKKRQAKGFFSSNKTYRMNKDYSENIDELIGLLINNSADDIIKELITINQVDSELTKDQMDILQQIFS